MRDWTTSNRVAHLARRLGTFDIALIVMGSVIGSGIFRTPSVVAQRAPEPALIYGAWIAGGIIALCGALVLGELAARRPDDCGAYAYFRDAFHPIVAFAYGWSALLAASSGGVAAAAVLFSGYFLSITGLPIAAPVVAAITLGILALLNALGIREGANTQNFLTALKVGALLALVAGGLIAHPSSSMPSPLAFNGLQLNAVGILAVALIPVYFSYNGAYVANFMAAETKDSRRALPMGLTAGMIGVALVYVLVNAVFVRVLGVAGLAHTDVPVAAVLSNAVGPTGTRLGSLAIALTTLGFMSNRMLTVPRLYHAMADDRLFFRIVAWINPRTHVPVVAVLLQAIAAIVIALSAGYGHILNYTVSVLSVFNGLLSVALFVLRARDSRASVPRQNGFRVPWHPVSTMVYLVASWAVAVATWITYPVDGLMGLAIVLSAVPVYFLWTRAGFARRAKA